MQQDCLASRHESVTLQRSTYYRSQVIPIGLNDDRSTVKLSSLWTHDLVASRCMMASLIQLYFTLASRTADRAAIYSAIVRTSMFRQRRCDVHRWHRSVATVAAAPFIHGSNMCKQHGGSSVYLQRLYRFGCHTHGRGFNAASGAPTKQVPLLPNIARCTVRC